MTDTNDMSNADHYTYACASLARSEGKSPEAGRELVATAQVQAILALVDAVERLTDSYNGWKDLGK